MKPIPILMYHHVAPVPPELRALRGLYVTPRAFARQMRLLRWLGFRGMSMSQAMPYLRGEAHGRVAVITLDDGYVDNLEHALPALLAQGFGATCYAVSALDNRYNHWDAERAGVREPLMSTGQMRAWHEAGMEIGAHTRSHAHLTQCSDADLRDQVEGCRNDLEDRVGAAVTQFCYPYGEHDQRVVNAVGEAGYVAATTTRRGRALPGSDPLRLPRIPISNRHLLPQVAARLLSRYEDRHE
ncbi:polysaccharide deacetylase family protein [Oleiagrimonas sp.]|jgi:peptidoglycan/xylan/chitin deacetylase (PgdA/CDA1 family)|uniref:polysaccharide deacetylase family protein n=1 Tax=Oleiagrimonas sp. TaxID=2010330 RepID=UPI0026218A46|nr:polysaccharide deacetylase family protein [Oleiagrimonas sp.]MDA3913356.1 polysaccharide deacetylase family protein [Oleiagrimonas sp.]